MKITGARVIVASPGRNYVTLKIETDGGTYGVGDATLNGRELAVASYLSEHVVPVLIGREAMNIEDTWQLLYRSAYWRRGPVTMAAIAAVDMALWDIKGKELGTPVWNLLGGRCRDGLLAYSHAAARSVDEVVQQVEALLQVGYRAVRAQCLVPGLEEMYGVPRAVAGREGRGLPFVEDDWSAPAYLRFVPRLFSTLRDAVGPQPMLLHDAHHRLTPSQAGWLGKRLEDFQLFWLEDAVPAEWQDGYKILRHHTTTPLAVGEVFNTIFDCDRLIRNGWIDYIRTSALHAGGITHLRKIADYAAPHHVKIGCHGAGDLSPITMAAAVHFGIATYNAAIQEHAEHSAATHKLFPHQWSLADGYLQPGDGPGLGVDIDEDLAAEFPYERAYLPVTRLEDGTVGDW